MSKCVKCGDIVPGCEFVAEGQDDAEVLAKVADHAKTDHGVTSVSPEIVAKVHVAIRPH